MRQDDRVAFDQALEAARVVAYPPGGFVGQESFMGADEIRALAARAGVDRESSVLDLCCGVGGPGRLIAAELGCGYLGLDASAAAVSLARARAAGLPCRFQVAEIPPVPAGEFDVVLLLETMLAFPDKEDLLRGVSSALRSGGRFACTVEVGPPLADEERRAMPDSDTVWPIPLATLRSSMRRVGLDLRWTDDWSASHRGVARSLLRAYEADRIAIRRHIGRQALEELLAAHRLWVAWLGTGRIRKLAVVAEKSAPAEPEPV